MKTLNMCGLMPDACSRTEVLHFNLSCSRDSWL